MREHIPNDPEAAPRDPETTLHDTAIASHEAATVPAPERPNAASSEEAAAVHELTSPPGHARARDRVVAAIAANSPAPAEPNSVAPAAESAPERSKPDIPHLDDDQPVLGLIDLDLLDEQFAELTTAFAPAAPPATVLHAVACKAVPLAGLLSRYARAGAGCEVASPGELELALAAGFAPERIVFDSPAKTWTQLRRAVDLGVSMNVDNFAELDRLDAILRERSTSAPAPTGGADGTDDAEVSTASAGTGGHPGAEARIGIRINPQTGAGAIGALSTATATSKFGIGLEDPGMREAVVDAYLQHPWLTQIHIHSGSQGVALEQAAAGIAEIVGLAEEINDRAGHRQVTRLDIGGGLPVNFSGEEITPTFADYAAVLEDRVPGLFDFDLVTEFGRALLAKAGTVLTRVEYAKTTGGRRIAMTHAGVQIATRTAYAPADWPLRILPYDATGAPKAAEEVATDVAGPACFSGDLLARDQMLPRLDAGDLVAVPETGAYYFSNTYSYNMLPRVPIVGYRSLPGANGGWEIEFHQIRNGQSVEELLRDAGARP